MTSGQGSASQGSATRDKASQGKAVVKGNTAMRTPAEDEAIDVAAIEAFTNQYGARATKLPELAIVIAAFNEQGSIGPVLEALPPEISGLEIAKIVVSDGSSDGTVKEADAALRLGYRLAREGGATYIVTTDADGQYNPAEIPNLLKPLIAGEADFASGSRAMGSEETKDPVRKLGVRVFALTISLLTGQKVTDPSFGLRAMRAEVTGAVSLRQPQYQSAELLIGVITHGYKYVELPATIHKRKVGQSKKGHNALYGLYFARVIGGTWWREHRRRQQAKKNKTS